MMLTTGGRMIQYCRIINKAYKYTIFVILLLLIESATASIRDAGTVSRYLKQHPHCKNRVSLLFMQQARRATLNLLSGKKRCYQLRLRGVERGVVYFSDQPQRMAGHISNSEFMALWRHNHVKPNIILHSEHIKNGRLAEFNGVFEISRPVYQKNNDSISYQACLLSPGVKQLNHVTMSQVVLFIDDFHPWP
jgi:hypothetical protein